MRSQSSQWSNTLTWRAPASGLSSTTALWFARLSLYILLPEFSAPLHALQHVFHAATQQSRINALWHPIRENAENVAVHCQRQHLRNSCPSYISEI